MLTIQRIHQPDCTLGVLNYESFRCLTLELPYLDNAVNISCIPAGLYNARKIHSNKFGLCIEICDVVNRTFIRIHYGNFIRQIEGCVLVGDGFTDIDKDGIIEVTNSKVTLKKLMAALPDTFQVRIS